MSATSTPSDTTLIVDDHALVRVGLRRLVDDHPRTGDIVEAASAEEALALVKQHSFALILMDISLPGLSGVECSLRILSIDPAARIIILTGLPEATHANRLLRAGVAGYLTKGCSAEEMHKAMSTVLANQRYVAAEVASELVLDGVQDSRDNPFDRLTRRESEVIMQVLDGKRNRQISEVLFISEKTVSTHRRAAFDKLGVDSTAELARLAIAQGLWSDIQQ
ncbi:MAG: response regulator transcription factor [Gammaproteobacteria bacterium]|nr:response regulator transcription factor [Gammaproteobacteria bacterium]